MQQVAHDIDRCLQLIRTKMEQLDYTQENVQTQLSWGRTYISQLLNKQKKLRLEQILAILQTIGVDRREFFAELFQLEYGLDGAREQQDLDRAEQIEHLRRDVQATKATNRRLLRLMVRKRLITAKEANAIA